MRVVVRVKVGDRGLPRLLRQRSLSSLRLGSRILGVRLALLPGTDFSPCRFDLGLPGLCLRRGCCRPAGCPTGTGCFVVVFGFRFTQPGCRLRAGRDVQLKVPSAAWLVWLRCPPNSDPDPNDNESDHRRPSREPHACSSLIQQFVLTLTLCGACLACLSSSERSSVPDPSAIVGAASPITSSTSRQLAAARARSAGLTRSVADSPPPPARGLFLIVRGAAGDPLAWINGPSPGVPKPCNHIENECAFDVLKSYVVNKTS